MAISGEGLTGWGNRILDLVERAYRIIRGKPHHRNTAFLLFIGGAILAGPFWEPYLRAAVASWLGLTVDLPTSPGFGLAVVLGALLYHVVMSHIENRRENAQTAAQAQADVRIRTHDAPLVASLLQTAPEKRVRHVLEHVRDTHSWFASQRNLLLDAHEFLDTGTNGFNDPEMAAAAANAKQAIDELAGFAALNFFIMDPMREDNLFTLHPHWNFDRGGNPTPGQEQQYRRDANDLLTLSQAAEEAYMTLIETANRRIL